MHIPLLAIEETCWIKEFKLLPKVYGAVQPALADYAPQVEKRVSSSVRAVKGEYDNIRDRLVNENRRSGHAIANVRSKTPDLGL